MRPKGRKRRYRRDTRCTREEIRSRRRRRTLESGRPVVLGVVSGTVSRTRKGQKETGVRGDSGGFTSDEYENSGSIPPTVRARPVVTVEVPSRPRKGVGQGRWVSRSR